MSSLQQNSPSLIEEIKKWGPVEVIKFLESKKSKKDEYFLNRLGAVEDQLASLQELVQKYGE